MRTATKNPPRLNHQPWLSVPQIAVDLGITEVTVWRWIKGKPDFPKAVKLSARVTRIPGDEYERWKTNVREGVK